MKKKTIYILIYFFSGASIFAQQKPQYSQYILNPFLLNPAFAGLDNLVDIKMSHRHQWVGIDGAPVTTYLTVNGPVGNPKQPNDNTYFSGINMPKSRADITKFRDRDVSTEGGHGLGWTIMSDHYGPFTYFSTFASYSYHHAISQQYNLSFGISAGIQQIGLATDKIIYDNSIPDPAVIAASLARKTLPSINTGLLLYSQNTFISISSQQVFPGKLKFSQDSIMTADGKLIPHILCAAGTRFYLDEYISVIPSFLINYEANTPLSFDINSKFLYQNIIGQAYPIALRMDTM
ncbi:MAG: hypothetical protein NVS3B19_07820 [Ginsengibacter sp.]